MPAPKGLFSDRPNPAVVKRLLVHGDPGIRVDDEIELDGERFVCFRINRNGEWHGPSQVQLWCIIGKESEREAFKTQNFTPHFLEVERVAAEKVIPVTAG